MEVVFGEDLKMILILVNGNLVNLMDMEFTPGLMVTRIELELGKTIINIFRRQI